MPRRFHTRLRAYAITAAGFTTAAIGPAAMGQAAPTTPAALIRWSMSKYAEMPSFQGNVSVKVSSNGTTGAVSTRTIQLVKPNRFKVVTTNAASTQTSVSDGKNLVEFMSGGLFPAQRASAPASIADSHSMLLSNPMLAGSLLYSFFGGPSRYATVVNEAKMAPVFGPPAKVAGVDCKTVKFAAQGFYGTTEAAIGVKDGLVHSFVYHYEPLVEQTAKLMKTPAFQAQLKQLGKGMDAKALARQFPTTMKGEETYTSAVPGQKIDLAVFTAKPPTGQQVQDLGGAPKPPVALGHPAPEITVKGVDGVSTKLAGLRGHVVLIDFWATWCPPCRKGLPETQALYDTYGKKGLSVLTISNEPKATVTPFLKTNKLTFPAYLDQSGATNKAYGITAIPTVAVIDKSGHLSSYFVGLQDKATIMAALKKAGL